MNLLGITPLLFTFIINHIQPVYSQCSGTTLVLNATDVYQVFTSVNYPSSYSNQQSCEWRIEADNATDAIRMEITDAEIEYHPECVYDYGEVFDGDNINATSLGRFCGTGNPSFVSYDNNMTVIFSSDYSMSKKGFKARYKSGPRSSLVDAEDESSDMMIYIIAGAAGFVVILIVVAIIVYKKIQAKNSKDIEPIQVQPFAVASTWSQRNHHHHPPPVYGGGNVSTTSPPPRYSDVGLHPAPFKQGDGIRNTHFVMPENLRRTTTQIGNNTNAFPPQSNGVITTNIANSQKPDPMPNEDTALARGEINTQTTVQNNNAETVENEANANNTNQPVSGTETTVSNTNEPTINYPANVNLLSLPRRNVPGESLSELLSDSEDDSETDSDEYDD